MKRVLLISFYYPPMPAVGALRAKGLAKYLPEFGWEVTVLHGPLESKGSLVHRLFSIDPNQNMMAQAQELQRKVKVPIEWALRLYAEWFKYPDIMPEDWGRRSLNEMLGIRPNDRWTDKADAEYDLTRNIDAIISTSSPASCHLAGRELKDAWHKPWIADFRDLWTQNHYYPYSRIRLRRERRLELETLETADTLVTVSEPLSKSLEELHGVPVHTILNGYDPDEVNDGSTPLTEHPTIAYTGNIYRGKQILSFEDSMLNTMLHEGYELRLYGPKQGWIDKMAEEHGIGEQVKQYGVVSHTESLQRQCESHALFYLAWEGSSGIYSAKLFEYLAAKRPIVTGKEPDSYIAKVIEDANEGNIGQYSQREMARKFATILDNLA